MEELYLVRLLASFSREWENELLSVSTSISSNLRNVVDRIRKSSDINQELLYSSGIFLDISLCLFIIIHITEISPAKSLLTQLNESYGLLALIGGHYNPCYIGTKAIYRNNNDIDEECYVLGFTSPSSPSDAAVECKINIYFMSSTLTPYNVYNHLLLTIIVELMY